MRSGLFEMRSKESVVLSPEQFRDVVIPITEPANSPNCRVYDTPIFRVECFVNLSNCWTVADVPECQNAIVALCLVLRLQKRHQRGCRRTPRRSKLSYLAEALERFQGKEIKFWCTGLARLG